MFRRRTLFVVGAGASAEFGLPVGTALARQITNRMDIPFERGMVIGSGDQRLYEQFMRRRGSGGQWQAAAMRIGEGLPFAQSIDDFLDQGRTDTSVNLSGKAAICLAILEAERESTLYFNPMTGDEPFNATAIADTWLVKFMYMLCIVEAFHAKTSLTYSSSALQRAYSLNDAEAAYLVKELDVLHPYGSVGQLAQVSCGNSDANCVALASQIKTYTEQADEETVLNKIHARLERAECVVFLGFAYHQNMQMLRTANKNGKVVYGTTFAVSNSDASEVNKSIAQTLAPSAIYVDNLRCAGLFDNYAKSLTGGD